MTSGSSLIAKVSCTEEMLLTVEILGGKISLINLVSVFISFGCVPSFDI